MTTEKPRSVAPVIGLGVLAAAIALTGVGVAASGATDPSHPSSLRVAQPVPTTATSEEPATSAVPQVDAASSVPATATPEPGTTATSATAAATDATTAAPEATAGSLKPAVSSSGSTSAAKPTAKATVKAAAKPTKSGAPAAPVAEGPGPSSAPSAGAGAAAGNYPETTTGNATYTGGSMAINGTPTLMVAAAQGQAQTQTTMDGNSTMVEKLVFGTNRVDATEISISSQIIDADFLLSPQQPIAELTAGATWSWKADSTDGKEHLALTGSYAGTEQVVVGGQTETAAIIKSTLTLTGSIATTINETDDYDTAYKLIVRDHSVTKGTYDGIAYTIDAMTTLNSLKPS